MNGHERNISAFRKLSAYIMQDNQLHGNLSVQEAMTVATNLKLSKKFTKPEKNSMVNYVNIFKNNLLVELISCLIFCLAPF